MQNLNDDDFALFRFEEPPCVTVCKLTRIPREFSTSDIRSLLNRFQVHDYETGESLDIERNPT
jgi:hypothetical protein